MIIWLLLHYKIPSKPTSSRVYVWRKLKSIGAVLLQDAVWVLPNTAKTQEQFQWLAAEIHELGGAAMLWESHLLVGQEENLISEMQSQVEAEYMELLRELEGGDGDLASISKRYHLIKNRDYFHSLVGQRVFEKLIASRRMDV